MEEVEKLIEKSMAEVEKVLSTKSVVGEPMTIEGNTIIPLVTMGFVFGAMGGSGKGVGKGDKGHGREGVGEGLGGGAAGAGGIRPTAVVIINKEGVKIESIKGSAASVLEKMGETVGKIVEKRVEK